MATLLFLLPITYRADSQVLEMPVATVLVTVTTLLLSFFIAVLYERSAWNQNLTTLKAWLSDLCRDGLMVTSGRVTSSVVRCRGVRASCMDVPCIRAF